MSSVYVFGPLTLWVSNGVAEALDHGWRRRLEGPLDEAVWRLDDFLFHQAEHAGAGCQGFNLDDAPLDGPDVRRRFARAMESLARAAWRVVAARATDDATLDWLGGHTPFWQASFLGQQALLHAAFRGVAHAHGVDLAPWILPVHASVRDALDAAVDALDAARVCAVLEAEIHRGLAPWRRAVTLRPARDEDIPALLRVERDADARFLDAGHPELADGEGIPEDVARRSIAQGRITVAEVDGAIAGWTYVGRVDGEACLGQISVATGHGRGGVGDALLDAVIARARRDGDASLVLNTQTDVPWNAPWFSRRGFVTVPRDAWSEGLRSIERAQTEAGLDWTTRAHMRLTLR